MDQLKFLFFFFNDHADQKMSIFQNATYGAGSLASYVVLMWNQHIYIYTGERVKFSYFKDDERSMMLLILLCRVYNNHVYGHQSLNIM